MMSDVTSVRCKCYLKTFRLLDTRPLVDRQMFLFSEKSYRKQSYRRKHLEKELLFYKKLPMFPVQLECL